MHERDWLSRVELKTFDVDLFLRFDDSLSNMFVDNMLREIFDTVGDTASPLASVMAGLSLAAEKLFE